MIGEKKKVLDFITAYERLKYTIGQISSPNTASENANRSRNTDRCKLCPDCFKDAAMNILRRNLASSIIRFSLRFRKKMGESTKPK
jgi:hypothetical protein